ncbi:MAG: TetR/AcrR family transcriptional regulator [Bacteroidia bacterium]|nr:TetR/AcrR family transcriptional regulator [Bacteroidia bacterium]
MRPKPAQRDRILATALRLFAERGFPQVTLRELAQRVQLSPATLYHYFPTKEALLAALAFQIAERFEAATAEIAESDWETTYKFERFCVRHVETLLAEPAQAAIFLREAPRHLEEPHRTAFLQRQEAYERRLERILEEGVAKNLFHATEPRFLAISLLAALNATANWYQPTGAFTPTQIAHYMATIFLRGLIRSW